MKKLMSLVGVLMILSAILVACGEAGSASTNISVDMTEFMFNPNNFTVPAGKEITLELTNNGTVEHDFIIMDYGTDVGQDFGEEDVPNVYFKAEVQPGISQTLTFMAPSQAGDYQVVCGVKGHYQAGMVATLHVVSE